MRPYLKKSWKKLKTVPSSEIYPLLFVAAMIFLNPVLTNMCWRRALENGILYGLGYVILRPLLAPIREEAVKQLEEEQRRRKPMSVMSKLLIYIPYGVVACLLLVFLKIYLKVSKLTFLLWLLVLYLVGLSVLPPLSVPPGKSDDSSDDD